MAANAEAQTIAEAVKKYGKCIEGKPGDIKSQLGLGDMRGPTFAAVLRSGQIPGVSCKQVGRGVFKVSRTG